MSDLYLLRGAFFDGLQPKRLIGSALLVSVPALICLIGRQMLSADQFNAEHSYNAIATLIVYSFTLTILSVVFATGVIALELEQKTIVYLLTRPVPRWRILLTRFIGKLTVVVVLCWLSTILLALCAYYPGQVFNERVMQDFKFLAVGALAYGSVSLMLAALTSRPLILGLVFAFGWETWVPQVPGEFKRFSIMTYLKVLAPHPLRNDQPDMPQDPTAAIAGKISAADAWQTLILVIIVALIVSLVAFSRKEFAPREDAG
jgi:ABC-2 type transport system permease protein